MDQLRLDPKEQLHLAVDEDPYEFVLSANIHRRHLTAEEKRDLIAKVLKAQPSKSNRTIAEQTKTSHVTVGAVRAELEATGQIDQLDKTVGKDGRRRPRKNQKGREKTVGKDGKRRRPPRKNPKGRADLHRRMKLGDETVNKLNGTSLGHADEITELVMLNRGAAPSEIVKQLVADAVAGKPVSALAVYGTTPAPNNDIGPPSTGELERLRARIDQLEADKRRLEIENSGLRREIELLQALVTNEPPAPAQAATEAALASADHAGEMPPLDLRETIRPGVPNYLVRERAGGAS